MICVSTFLSIQVTWLEVWVLTDTHNTCSTTDIASETIALRDKDKTFNFFVYAAPMTRISGMTRKESNATCQQLINAIMMPAKKVEKLAMK
jgi:hypothetical protein